METEAIAHFVQQRADDFFRRGVLAANARHVPASALAREAVFRLGRSGFRRVAETDTRVASATLFCETVFFHSIDFTANAEMQSKSIGGHQVAVLRVIILGDRLIRLATSVQSELIPVMLFLRALIAFLVLPGTFAGLIPAWIVSSDRGRGEGWTIGAVPLAVGIMVLLWCVRDFCVSGRGTLAPWDPPKRLVIVGLYRFTRNPMYVGVLVLLAGWSLLAASPSLGIYSLILALAFHLRVLLYEEPTLAKNFPEEWAQYAATVPRWLPRLPRSER